jgi:hypothetical protein
MNVKLFRLNSGEEILARFEDQGDSWLLKDPAILIPVGEGNIGLMPWMMYTKAAKGVTIAKSFVPFTVDPLDELNNQYDTGVNKCLVTTSSKGVDPLSKLKLTT